MPLYKIKGKLIAYLLLAVPPINVFLFKNPYSTPKVVISWTTTTTVHLLTIMYVVGSVECVLG